MTDVGHDSTELASYINDRENLTIYQPLSKHNRIANVDEAPVYQGLVNVKKRGEQVLVSSFDYSHYQSLERDNNFQGADSSNYPSVVRKMLPKTGKRYFRYYYCFHCYCCCCCYYYYYYYYYYYLLLLFAVIVIMAIIINTYFFYFI